MTFIDLKMWFIGLAHLHRAGAACFEHFWTNDCAWYFLLWAASSKNCRLDGKMDPQRQTPRCKRTPPGFTGWNHSKMRLQTPGGTVEWIGRRQVIMKWPWSDDVMTAMSKHLLVIYLICSYQSTIGIHRSHRFVTEISYDHVVWVDELVLRTLLMLGGELRPRHLKEAKAILELAAMLLRLDGGSKAIVSC